MTVPSSRLALLIVLGLGTALVGGASAQQPAYQGQTLQVGVYGGGTGKAFRESVTEPFTKRTGATIAWSEGVPEDFIAQLAGAKGGTPPYDVIVVEDLQEPQAIAQGVVVKPDYAKMPNTKLLDQAAVADNGYGPTFMWFRMGVAVLPEKLAAAGIPLPKDVSIIFDPRLAGHLAIPDITQTNWPTVMPPLAAFLHAPLDDPAPTLAKIASIKGAALYNSSSDLEARMSSGEIWVSLWTDGRTNGLRFKGINIEFLPMGIPNGKGGTNNYVASRSMLEITNPKKKDLAELYIDTMLSTPVQTKFALLTTYPPANVEALKAVKADPKVGPLLNTELNKEYRLDAIAWEKVEDRWVDAWGKTMRH